MEIPELPQPDNDPNDLFSPSTPPKELPSESVYCDDGSAEIQYIGEVQVPDPIPVELYVIIKGFRYIYKLNRREKDDEQ